MFSDSLSERATKIVADAAQRRIKLALAESCTAGLLSGLITSVPGASSVLDRGLVTYSNDSKTDLLDVPPALLATYGAVSEQVALAMAEGCLAKAPVHLALAITGIAGPAGGTPRKPVGLVHFAVAGNNGHLVHAKAVFPDTGRQGIRLAALDRALDLLQEALTQRSRPGG